METGNSERRAEMVKLLSEAIDSLIDAVISGRAGFDYAVKEYADRSDNELSRAFEGFVKEMELGDSQPIYGDDDEIPELKEERREALLNVARRVNVPEVTTFVDAMIEANYKGISVVEALRSQAEQLHQKPPRA